MSVENSSHKLSDADRKANNDVDTFELDLLEDDNDMITFDAQVGNNRPEDEQHILPPTKQKKMRGHGKKSGMTAKDVDLSTAHSAITINNEETNDRTQLKSNAVEIKNGSPRKCDEIHLNVNGEQTVDQSQVTPAASDADNALGHSMRRNRRVVDIGAVEQKRLSMNASNPIKTALDPIEGYAEEKLLPLSKACAPLTDIIHDLSMYVQLALDETPEVPSDGLTIDESAAIRLYTIEWQGQHRSLYSLLNRTLKSGNREALRPYFKYLKLFLTGLVKLPCAPPQAIWRGVTKDMSADFPLGTQVTWWAFSSCTTSLSILEDNMFLGNMGARTLFSVEAINGRAIREHSQNVNEDEMLLPPGTHMVVQSLLSPAPDLHIIHLKQVIPEEMLLEPPFKGALLYPKTERRWYLKKRFIIPISVLAALLIVAIVVGSVLGTRSTHNTSSIPFDTEAENSRRKR